MENLLLLLDELDDAAAVLRVLWVRSFGFFLACGLFTLTIIAALRWPLLAASALFVTAAWLGLSAAGKGSLPRFKTDP